MMTVQQARYANVVSPARATHIDVISTIYIGFGFINVS